MPKKIRSKLKQISAVLKACETVRNTSNVGLASGMVYEKVKKTLEQLNRIGIIDRTHDDSGRGSQIYVWGTNHDGLMFNFILQKIIEEFELKDEI
jgi:predicted transcriptional regulator